MQDYNMIFRTLDHSLKNTFKFIINISKIESFYYYVSYKPTFHKQSKGF